MPPETRSHDGVSWIEIKQAAKHSRTKAVIIAQAIEAGSIPSLEIEGKTYIPFSAANRLKREAATMAKVRRLNRSRQPLPARNPGVLSKEGQDVLPMSSGRAGRGWAGKKSSE
jgi:hypothetical protein